MRSFPTASQCRRHPELPNANPKAMFLMMCIGHRRFDKLPASVPSKDHVRLGLGSSGMAVDPGLCNSSRVPGSYH
jgi:hypothetical protein